MSHSGAGSETAAVKAVKHEEALQAIYDFCLANNYHTAIAALQLESKCPYNTICESGQGATSSRCKNAAALREAVMSGKWDVVLADFVEGLLLPDVVSFRLYETVFAELLTVFGVETAARALLKHSPVFARMHTAQPARFARLEQQLLAFVPFDTTAVVTEVPAAALAARTAVLGDLERAIRFVKSVTPDVLLLRAAAAAAADTAASPSSRKRTRDGVEEAVVKQEDGTRGGHASSGGAAERDQFAEPVPQCPNHLDWKLSFASSSEDTTSVTVCEWLEGALVVVGSSQGVLCLVDTDSGALVGAPTPKHKSSVTCICVNAQRQSNSAFAFVVVAGYQDGAVKMYALNEQEWKFTLLKREESLLGSPVSAIACAGRAEGLNGMPIVGLFCGSFRGKLVFCGVDSPPQVLPAHDGTCVTAIASFADLRSVNYYAVSGGADGRLRWWPQVLTAGAGATSRPGKAVGNENFGVVAIKVVTAYNCVLVGLRGPYAVLVDADSRAELRSFTFAAALHRVAVYCSPPSAQTRTAAAFITDVRGVLQFVHLILPTADGVVELADDSVVASSNLIIMDADRALADVHVTAVSGSRVVCSSATTGVVYCLSHS